MEDFREEIMAGLDKKPARTQREAAVVIEKVSGLKRSLLRGKHKKETASLVSENFQLFTGVFIPAA
jgi:hypothetical protein